jgi:FtsH-binding integral membrane protein
MTKDESAGMFVINSKFMRTTLLIVSVLLIFAGPTYVPYVLTSLNINYWASILVGLVLLIVGLVLLWFLIRKKVVL